MMNVKTRIAAGAAAAAMVSLLGAAGTPANADSLRTQLATATATATAATATVTGTVEGRAFTGKMSNLSASVVNGTATLSGSLKGAGLPAAGTKFTTAINLATAVDPVPAPVPTVSIPSQPECEILAVSVSDLRLNLLGLIVLIPELQLTAGGVTGPDALLGNVLCKLAGAAG